ncbi:MAG: YeeE/YedE thiosulfate transporter family protein [Cyanobium sp. CZS 25K]|nr:YeeE/YedE thiosulfate transporter family protein [Cyanobium sp. CZS25K]
MGNPFPTGGSSFLGGGLLMGLGLVVMYSTLGVKAGASSFLSSTLTYVTPLKAERSSRQWRLFFATALVLGAWLHAWLHLRPWPLRGGLMVEGVAAGGDAMKRLISIGVGGGLFGYGLAWSGMNRPEVVLNFLHLHDFGLLLVMAAALAVTAVGFRLAPRLGSSTLLGLPFSQEVKPMKPGTVPGAVIFGVGWGLSGLCSGAAVAGVGIGNGPVLIGLAGMFLGAWLQGMLAEGATAPEDLTCPMDPGAAPGPFGSYFMRVCS